MGVHGLWSLLEPYSRPIALESLAGKKLAVDASIWLHQFLKAMRDEEGESLAHAHIIGFLRRICKLLFFGIRPVFVFDGGVPLLKKSTIEKRANRRAGLEKNYKRVASDLLDLQLKRRVLSHSTAVEFPKRPDALADDLPANTVYASDLNPTRQAIVEAVRPVDPRLATQAELSDFVKNFVDEQQLVDYGLDVHSAEFKRLPVEMQYELVSTAKLKSRESTFARSEQLLSQLNDPLDFSKAQIQGLVKRNNWTQQLFQISSGKQANPQSSQVRRVVGERGKQYSLVKSKDGEPLGGGWVMRALDSSATKDEYKAGHNSRSLIQQADYPVEVEQTKPSAAMERANERLSSLVSRFQGALSELNLPHSDGCALPAKSTIGTPGSSLEFAKPLSLGEVKRPLNTEDSAASNLQKLEREREAKPLENAHERHLGELRDSEDEYDYVERHLAQFKEEEAPLSSIKDETLPADSTASHFSPIGGVSDCCRPVPTKHDELCETMTLSSDSEEFEEVTVDGFLETLGSSESKSEDSKLVGHPRDEELTQEKEFSGAYITNDSKNGSQSEQEEPETFESAVSEANPTSTCFLSSVDAGVTSRVKGHYSSSDLEEANAETHLPSVTGFAKVTDFRTSISPETNSPNAGALNRASRVESASPTGGAAANLGSAHTVSEPEVSGGGAKVDPSQQGLFMANPLMKVASLDSDLASEPSSSFEYMSPTDASGSAEALEESIRNLRKTMKSNLRDASSVDEQMTADVQELLNCFGIPYVVAPLEAESQCAFLVGHGLVDGVVTDDSDVFLFGGTMVYRNMFNRSKYVELYNAKEFERESGIGRTQLVSLAYLLGSDYTEGVRSLGIVKGVEIIKTFDEEVESNARDDEAAITPLVNFKNFCVRARNAKEKLPDNLKQFKTLAKKLSLGDSWPDVSVARAYLSPIVDESLVKFAWGEPNVAKIRMFLQMRVKWDDDKINAMLLPVLREMNQKRKTQTQIIDFLQVEQQKRRFASKKLEQLVTKSPRREKKS